MNHRKLTSISNNDGPNWCANADKCSFASYKNADVCDQDHEYAEAESENENIVNGYT